MTKNRRLDKAGAEVTRSLKLSRIIIPVLIGIGVVAYLLWKQFDPVEFAKINWTFYTLVWVGIAAGFLIIRHLAYAMRLWLLSDKFFTFKKCIKLIFLWEFSSAITPTAVGGSAVALFVISKEKLSFARTTTIVLHTVVLDTLFFIGILPLLFLVFGSNMIRPDIGNFMEVGGWGFTFIITYLLMAGYGTFFYYGLFRNPNQLKRLLVIFTYNRFLKRYRQNAIDLGMILYWHPGNLPRKILDGISGLSPLRW
jgi:glycosyltransferase 2 family protein